MNTLTRSPDALFVFRDGTRTTEKNWPQPPAGTATVRGPSGNVRVRLVDEAATDYASGSERAVNLYCEEGMPEEDVQHALRGDQP